MAVLAAPWPGPTPPPPLPPSEKAKGKRKWDGENALAILPRQSPDPSCDDVGNFVLSCAPVTGQIVVQNTSMHFVWNRNEPSFAQFEVVDVYLFHADNLAQATNKTGLQNQAGRTAFAVNDSWWGPRGDQWDGHNVSFPMYFIVVPGGHVLTGGEPPQSTFTAIQTRLPDSILAAQASSSAAASSSSVAASLSQSSASSASAASASSFASSRSGGSAIPSSTSTSTSGSRSSGLQNADNDNSFPHWAIALLAVLGTLALLAILLVFFLLLRSIRSRKRGAPRRTLSNRGSIGSSTPIMAQVGSGPASPVQPPPGGGVIGGVPKRAQSLGGVSTATSADPGLISNADAAIMAAAFRDTLRNPAFPDRPIEEGESPDSQQPQKEVLQRELAEEGRDIRSVNSSRVRVEGDESTIQGHDRDPDYEHDEPEVDRDAEPYR